MAINYTPDDETPEEHSRQFDWAENVVRPKGFPPAVMAKYRRLPDTSSDESLADPVFARLLIEGEAGAVELLADLAKRLGLTATLLPDSADELPDETAGAPAPTGYRRSDHFGWARDVLEVGPDLFKDDDVN